MIDGFIFDGDVVLHLLIVVSGILACFFAVGAVVFLLTRAVERDCRNDLSYDDDGRRQ